MRKPCTYLPIGLGAALILGACGDDGGGESSAATTGAESVSSSSSTTTPDTPTTTPDPTTTGLTEGGMTEAMSSTDEPATTTTTNATEPETTTESPGTTTTTDPGTTTADDTTTDDSTTGIPPDQCPLALQHKPCDAMSNDALHAMGLNCTTLGGDWVNNDNAVALQNLDFQAPPVLQGKRTWQVAKAYGTYVDPMTQKPFWNAREGDKLLMISSGLLPAPDNQGVITIPDGMVYNDTGGNGQWDNDAIPPPMSPQEGSPDPMGFTNCDGVGDCSNTIKAQWDLGNGNPEDKMWFSFDLVAPSIAAGDTADANGYTFEFAMFSAEFPEYVGASVNDMFIAWQASEAYTGNVTFINGQPMTVTALWPVDFQGQCNIFEDFECQHPADPHLQGTGHIVDGGATGWYKAIGGVAPGETFTLAFAVFDMGDSTFDTTALIDNWLWDCEGCVPNEVDDCEIRPQ